MAQRQREAAESEGALAAARAALEEGEVRAAAQRTAAEAAAADAAARAEEATAAAAADAAAAAARLASTEEARCRLDDELQARASAQRCNLHCNPALQPSAFERRPRARSPRAFSLRATLRAQEARGAVRVYCRLRPLRPAETGPAAAVAEHDAHRLPSKVLLRCPSAGGGSDEERCFEFDRVFGSEASTEQVFDDRMQARARAAPPPPSPPPPLAPTTATATSSIHHRRRRHQHHRPGACRPWRPRCRTAAARR